MNPAAAAPKPTIIPTKAVTGGLFGRLKCHNSLSLSRIPAERNKVASACFALLRERATMSERRTERENRTPLQKEQTEQNVWQAKWNGTDLALVAWLQRQRGGDKALAEREERKDSFLGRQMYWRSSSDFFLWSPFLRAGPINQSIDWWDRVQKDTQAWRRSGARKEQRRRQGAARVGSLSPSTQASYQSNQLG